MTNEVKKVNTSEVDGVLTESVLVEPWITEASTAAMELNKYVFKVSPRSVKGQIKRAIENLYNVEVISVNTTKIPRKKRYYGKTPGWKSGYKKAVVTLKAGDKIELFQGV
ncbi:MAG TPA: 50S ribosomal protein L23 [Candidatus Moranbacteria bacterium]|nr:50S ribosomal protein L23 [Candidatus Moranbacteria bacterium]